MAILLILVTTSINNVIFSDGIIIINIISNHANAVDTTYKIVANDDNNVINGNAY